MVSITFMGDTESDEKKFSKATVYTNSSVVRGILFFSKFKYGYYNAFEPISGENTTFKDEIKEFTNWSF